MKNNFEKSGKGGKHENVAAYCVYDNSQATDGWKRWMNVDHIANKKRVTPSKSSPLSPTDTRRKEHKREGDNLTQNIFSQQYVNGRPPERVSHLCLGACVLDKYIV